MFTFEYLNPTKYSSFNDNFYLDLSSNYELDNLRDKLLDDGIVGIDLGNLDDDNLINKFNNLCSCVGSSVVRDALRRTKNIKNKCSNDGEAASVDPDVIHRPHSEASFSPAKPAIICFICTEMDIKAAKSGMLTVLDGKKIWKELSIQTKKCLLNSNIVYDLAIDIPLSSKQTSSKRREWYLDSVGVKDVEIDKGLGKMYLKFTTPFVTEHPLTRELALANHAFIDPNTENQIIKRSIILNDDSSDSAQEIRLDLSNILEKNIKTVEWRKGRCLLIDNYRFMHGRLQYNKQLKQEILIKQLKKFALY